MTEDPSLDRKIVSLYRTLSEAGIPVAVGGAVAFGFYGEPRMTIDVDLNLFVEAERFEEIARILNPLGVDTGADASEVSERGQVQLSWGRNPVDLFFAYDPFHEAMRTGARKVPFAGERIEILAPEHLIVCKAAFDRPKDWIDIEQMLVAVDQLDRDELFGWLGRVIGSESEGATRIARFWSEYR
jgi:hypothetical protein